MPPAYILWDETKRLANLDKHGLDFIDAVMVLDSPYRLDIENVRGGNIEHSFSPTCLMF